MKFFEIDEEYLKKGGLITRDKKSGLAFGIVNGRLVAFKNGVKLEPEEMFKGYATDLLASDWERVGLPQKEKKYIPKFMDKYYYISATGKVLDDSFRPCVSVDIDRLNFNNVFKTKEDAQKMLKKLKIINKLRELSNIDFKDTSGTPHYAIVYDGETNEISYNVSYYYKDLPFNLYFATVEDCKKAIETIGEENLKKYYFDVVE